MLTVLAPRIGNDVSYVMRMVDDIDFVWQAQHLVRLDLTLLAPRIGNDVAYVMRIVDDLDFVWQAQYLVRLEGDFS